MDASRARRHQLFRTSVLGAALGCAAGCREQSRPPPHADPLTLAAAELASARASAASSGAPTPPATPPPRETDEPPEPTAGDAGPSAGEQWVLGELYDVGPAGPAAAHGTGIVMVAKSDQLFVAPVETAAKRKTRPDQLRFGQIEAEPDAFFPTAAGPAVLGEHAYFTSRGRLIRRRLDGTGTAEVLASDARSGARVATAPREVAAEAGDPATVAYLAEEGADLVAKLWVEGAGTRRLSPEGTAANSVALARTADGLLAVSLEGRTSMSPVHARRITFAGGKPTIGEDVVVWVAGSAQQLTELHAVSGDGDLAWGFLPIERDSSHYGLARIVIDATPRTDSPVSWRSYPNGLDPAPADGAHLCGRPTVAYARPADQQPHAPQELHLATVEEAGLGRSEVVAHSRAFANVSVASVPGGAVIAYVADRRTWARGIACGKPATKQPTPRSP